MQGSKPEISTLRKRMIQHLSNGRLDRIVENMSDKEYVAYCLQIFEYVMPRMNRVEFKGEMVNKETHVFEIAGQKIPFQSVKEN